ncbi:hypothetical protein L484_020167 [Morus notabilis]|uniref:Uncharacterized protein n=1 Tax=Morus notabilis TaxID=981085 RepID=W9R9W9_9ROSA|nr:hypothetical protein L484_020167 [Morus notabilis]
MDVSDLCVRNTCQQERINGQALQRSSPDGARHSLDSTNERTPLVKAVDHIISRTFQCSVFYSCVFCDPITR